MRACTESRESVGTEAEARIKQTVQQRSTGNGDACMVCGAATPTVAHLLPNEGVCRRFGVPFDESNFLLLCGTKDELGTCHRGFDTMQFGFQHMPNGQPHEWRVLGGRFNLSLVNLWTNPHVRVLAAHLAEVILAGVLTPVHSEMRRNPSVSSDDEPGIRCLECGQAHRRRDCPRLNSGNRCANCPSNRGSSSTSHKTSECPKLSP